MPQPIMKFGSITLKNGTDYTIRYANNTNVGLATVAVSGQGNYTGTAAKQFAIYEKSVGVEIKDQQTPQTSVNGLQNLYQDTSVYTQDDHQVEQSGGSVKIQMSVQAVSDPSTSAEKIQKIASGKTIGLYLDLSLKKIVTLAGQQSSTTTAISHVNDLLTVVIPIPDSLKGKENLAIYRVHEGIASVIPLGKENAVDGEYCTIDANNITLYVKNFSTYAIGYASSKNQTTHNPNTGENPLSVPMFALSAVLAGLALANKVYKFKRKRSV